MELAQMMADEVRRNLAANDRPRVPIGCDVVWKWFADLNNFRTWSMAGPDPIPYREMEAYGRIFGWYFRPKDIAVLRAMDDAYLAHFREKQGKTGRPAASGGPITSALFDAMFA
jgi:hypothetical protein